MQDLPHRYRVTAHAVTDGEIVLTSPGAPDLVSQPPPEFDGPGGFWSPESLLTAAVADCFVLSFRAVAAASRVPFISLDCDVEGTLERIERRMRFTGFVIHAHLKIAADVSPERAQTLLEKAEANCLVSNSLAAEIDLRAEVTTA